MQLQFHPASGRGAVRTISLGPGGERGAIAAAAVLALLAVSMWFTVPAVSRHALRENERLPAAAESRRAADEKERLGRETADLRLRAREMADLLNRAAFLYAVPASVWPRILAPEHRLLAAGPPEKIAAALPAFLRGLENGRAILEAREREDPAAAAELPSILPLGHTVFEPSAYFGPRRSPWTNAEEFLTGIEIAAPAGSPVVAPAGGTVTFAGTVRRSIAGSFWQLGNVVVLSHGSRGATVFGHLARIDVRRGQKLDRGDRLGAVGSTGWTLSPQLHYELWRPDGPSLRPTDPLFAILDQSFERRSYSLEQMEATWAPGPLEPLPGIGVAADLAAGHASPTHRVRRRKL